MFPPPYPKPRRTHCAAFSVLEIAIALAVVAVLAILLYPWARNTAATARAAQCLGNLRALGVAAHGFIGDRNGFLPYRPADPNWMYNLGPYLNLAPTIKNGDTPFTKAFLCPDDPSRTPRQKRTYRYHQSFPSPGGAFVYGRSNYTPSRFQEIRTPSSHGMIFCVAYTGPRTLAIWAFDEAIWKKEPDQNTDPALSNFPRPHYQGKGLNLLYSDGHAARANYPLDPLIWHFDGRAE